MIMNIVVIVLVLSIAYAWMVRGIFNAMLHMLSALIAGAIAFALWEPLAVMLIKISPERGFGSFLESIAWGVALIVPFAVAFVLLRVLSDKVVPNNIKNATIVDYVGGGIFGAVTAVISMGILIIGVGHMRVASNFLGYQPLWYSADRANGAGSLVRNDSLWIPVDSITARLYGKLSQGVMGSNEPLTKWYPELELTGLASRLSPGNGAARNALNPDDFKVLSSYSVGSDAGSDKISDLLKIDSGGTQRYVDIDDKPVSNGQLMGYVLEFEPGAKERGKRAGGQLVISNGQIRLLVQDNDGKTHTIFPVATISESAKPGEFGRWRFDADGVFITSTGGKSKVSMGFEFVVPQGQTPVALYVKNLRVPASELPDPVNYPSVAKRDRLVRTGSILKGESNAPRILKTENMVVIDSSDQDAPIDVTTRMLDVVGTVAAKRGLTLNDQNEIVDGQNAFDVKSEVGRKNTPQSKKLRCERYAAGAGQKLIKLDVSPESPIGLLSAAARFASTDEPLMLIDDKGNEYEAIGFEYKDRELMRIRYTRGSTLKGTADMPTLSTTRDDQTLRLLFIITDGAKISTFAIGDEAIARFNPPIDE